MEEFEQHWEIGGERVDRRELDGEGRISMLPIARFVAIAPGASAEDPPYVFIEWAPGVVERPCPGSAIWRAVLHRYITEPPRADVSQRVLRPLIAACLERFPSLESWARWATEDRAARIEERARERRRSSERLSWWVW